MNRRSAVRAALDAAILAALPSAGSSLSPSPLSLSLSLSELVEALGNPSSAERISHSLTQLVRDGLVVRERAWRPYRIRVSRTADRYQSTLRFVPVYRRAAVQPDPIAGPRRGG